LIVNATHRAR